MEDSILNKCYCVTNAASYKIKIAKKLKILKYNKNILVNDSISSVKEKRKKKEIVKMSNVIEEYSAITWSRYNTMVWKMFCNMWEAEVMIPHKKINAESVE